MDRNFYNKNILPTNKKNYDGFNSGFVSGFENRNNSNLKNHFDNSDSETFKINNHKMKLIDYNSDKLVYSPKKNISLLYQICQFSINKKYYIRKLYYNENLELIKKKIFLLSKRELEKFIKKSSENKILFYPVYTLPDIRYPNINEILISKSKLLQ